MADIQSAAAEIRRGKKKRRKKKYYGLHYYIPRATITNHSMKIYMVCRVP